MEALITSLTTAMSGVVTDITSALTSIAPLAIPLIGITMVVTIGIGVFKKVTKKSAS